jgi:Ser/Thr protein kinase RdoA (MazF antagonist)
VIAKKRNKTTFDRAAEKLVRQKQALAAGVPETFDTKALGKPHVSHGDFHAENVFFSKQGAVTHVFDFEKFEIFPRSLELFRSLHLICFGDGFSEKNFRKGREYIKAYNAVYPIKRAEFAAAVYYSSYRHVFGTWIEAEHYLHNNTRPDIFLRSDARAVQYFSVHTNDFINRVWPE